MPGPVLDILLVSHLIIVLVARASGCEGIHKAKEVKRVKFLSTLPERRGTWCGEIHSLEGWGL